MLLSPRLHTWSTRCRNGSVRYSLIVLETACDDDMATRVVLPEEAIDFTTTELREIVHFRPVVALQHAWKEAALVFWEIFLSTCDEGSGDVDHVAADMMVVPRARPGRHRVHKAPDEPAPAAPWRSCCGPTTSPKGALSSSTTARSSGE